MEVVEEGTHTTTAGSKGRGTRTACPPADATTPPKIEGAMLSGVPLEHGGDVEELFGLVQGVEVERRALSQRGDQARHPGRAAEPQAPGHRDAGADPDRPGPPELPEGPHARVAVLGGLARSHQADVPVTSVRAVLDAQLQVQADSQTQRVEARPEVGRRGRHPHDHDGSAWPIGLEGRVRRFRRRSRAAAARPSSSTARPRAATRPPGSAGPADEQPRRRR